MVACTQFDYRSPKHLKLLQANLVEKVVGEITQDVRNAMDSVKQQFQKRFS